MAELHLFHHAQGLTAGCLSFADESALPDMSFTPRTSTTTRRLLTSPTELEAAGAVFGLGLIVWFAWMGAIMLRGDSGR